MTDPEPNAPRKFRFVALWLLLAASVIMTYPALKGPLLGYDDVNLITAPGGAAHKAPWEFFTGAYYYAYLPVYGLSYWFDIKVAGGADSSALAGWLHFVNVLWHAAAGYALFCLLLRLMGNRTAALFGALLFVLHPIHVESVAWISGRKELVSAFFLFVSWLLYLRVEEGSRRATVGALACFLIACFAKASAVVLPALLVLAAWLLPRYEGRRRVSALRTFPFWIAAFLPVLVHLLFAVDRGIIREFADLGQRFVWWGKAWGDSIGRTLLPIGLSIEYPEVRAASGGEALLSGVWIAAAVASMFALRRRAPYVAFGIAAFLVALAPFNNVFPATDVLAADRYLYLSLIGFAVVGGWVASLGPRWALGAGAVAAGYLALSLHGAGRFDSDEILWSRTIDARPESAIAYLNRGIDRTTHALTTVPVDKALLDAGVADLKNGVEKAKRSEIRAKGSLALVVPLLHVGEEGEALQRADKALALVTGTKSLPERQFRAQALYDRGLVRKTLGSYDVAATDFDFSARLVPSFDSHFEAGRCFSRANDVERARKSLRAAAQADRKSFHPWLELAALERRTQDRDAERGALDQAAARSNSDPAVVAGWVNFWLGGESPNWRRAKKELERIDSRDPTRKELAGKIDARRALYLFRRGELADAITAADDARDAGLSKSRTLYELGEVYMSAARYATAARCFVEAADVLDEQTAWRSAAARAHALNSYVQLQAGNRVGALRAVDAAIDLRPPLIEAGMAPLRGEVEMLAKSKNEDVRLLAVAAVAGDPAMGRRIADRIFGSEPADSDVLLALRLRALMRVFVTHDFRGAETDLGEVLAKQPGERWVRYRLAQARLRNGVGWMRTAEQIQSVERRKEAKGMIQSSVALLTELLGDDPGFVHARLLRGEAWFSLDEEIGAKADYQRVREQAPLLKEVYLREAVLHRFVYVKGGSPENLTDGIRILRRSLTLDPNYFDALFELGNMHHLLYDRPDAGTASRRTSFVQAILAYRRAMAINPRAKEPREEWARICLKAEREAVAAGDLVAAHKLLLQVAQDASDIAELHKERVTLNVHPEFARKTNTPVTQAYKQAFEALQHLEQLAPEDPELKTLQSLYQRRLGASYLLTWIKQKDPKLKAEAKRRAIEALRLAVQIAPEDPENAQVRVRLRQLAPEFIELDEKQAKEAYARAVVLFEQGKYEESVAGFREAHLLIPEAPKLACMYGLALARAVRIDEAKKVLERVANGDTGNEFPEAMFELGQICLVQKSREAARMWFERYLRVMEASGRDEFPGVAAAKRHLEKLKSAN
ncbi:MAG: tetratricopeptide repeat protein [Planctomycetota bacterium]|jgi:tetratricopeptide (TPR) repeat protein